MPEFLGFYWDYVEALQATVGEGFIPSREIDLLPNAPGWG